MTGFAAIPIAEDGGESDKSVHLTGISKILGPRWLQLPAITIGLLGVQIMWSVEMSYGTPYLISLGLSKSAMSMVFLAGPISGLIVQPLIGVLADNSKSRFGRRRPYILLGISICVAAMLLLGFTRPFATLFTPQNSIANNILTICLAIFAIFCIDFSINAVQAVDRALLVDTLPTNEQADGNAWAARMLGIGSVAGYFVGNVDMTRVFPFFGETELEVLAVVGSLLLIATHSITASCVKEKVVVATKGSKKSILAEFKEIWDSARTLPSVIKQICIIQFFAWIGWFPVLFYTTAFVGELHKRSFPNIPSSDPNLDAEATRLGSRAMFYNSLVNLVSSIILPFFVTEAAGSRRSLESQLEQKKRSWLGWFQKAKIHLATLWAISLLVFAICMEATFFYSSVHVATIFVTITGFSWALTQWAPFSLLAEAILTEGSNTHDDTHSILLNDTRTSRHSGDIVLGAEDHERQFLVGKDDDDDAESDLQDEVQSFRSSASMDRDAERSHLRNLSTSMTNIHARVSHLNVHALSDDEDLVAEDNENAHSGNLASKAGIIIGIHNIFIVMPQFIISAVASLIFAIVEPGKVGLGPPIPGIITGNNTLPSDTTNSTSSLYHRAESAAGNGANSYAIIFRLGGISAAVACILTIRLARELRHR